MSQVVLALISGLMGALLTSVLYLRFERSKMRQDVARRLMGFRYDVPGDEFIRALNEVYVVFHDDQKVIEALKAFHDVTVSNQEALNRPRLITLLKEVMRASGIDTTRVGDAFFETPFKGRIVQR
jgi:uncharacterized protein DUF6680